MRALFNYKLWIIVLFANYVFIDFFRRFFEWNKLSLLLLDVNLLIIFFFFFSQHKSRIKGSIYNLTLRCFLFLYAIMVTLQIGNFSMSDFVTTFAGFRSYLLAVPLLWIGYDFAQQQSVETLQRFSKTLLFLSVLSIIYALYLFFFNPTSQHEVIASLLKPMGHPAHSFGSNPQTLTSSFFASSWRFSAFLIVSYLVLWGVARHQGRSVLLLFIFFLAGFFVAGSRSTFSIFLLYNFIALFAFLKKKGHYTFLFLSAGIICIPVYMLVASSLYQIDFTQNILNNDFVVRIDYLFNDVEEYFKRLEMAFPISRINLENPDIYFGLGLGKYGQEAILTPFVASKASTIAYAFFHEKYQYPVADSGLAKIIIEMGLIGALMFSLFIVTIAICSLITIIKAMKRKDYVAFSIAWFPICWLFFFSKGHPTISDLGMSSFLYLSIGFTLAKLDYYTFRKDRLRSKPYHIKQFANSEHVTNE